MYSPCDPDASPVSVSDFGASLDPVLISQTPEYTLRRLRVPRGLALGQASVLVRNARGAVSNAIPLWIGAGRPAPMLDAVQPAQARDGQRVRLTGTGFRRVGGVLIGGGRARRVRVISSRQIVATVLGS